ncbi:MAG: hypothetical protein IKA61_04070 [Clostridia bacterium]|nr:hypothetical protein [Clostridia bacterium]
MRIKLLIAPIPTAKIIPPTKLIITCPIPASNGLTIDIIINKNIPSPKQRHIDSHVFCFAITLMIKNMETNKEM